MYMHSGTSLLIIIITMNIIIVIVMDTMYISNWSHTKVTAYIVIHIQLIILEHVVHHMHICLGTTSNLSQCLLGDIINEQKQNSVNCVRTQHYIISRQYSLSYCCLLDMYMYMRIVWCMKTKLHSICWANQIKMH